MPGVVLYVIYDNFQMVFEVLLYFGTVVGDWSAAGATPWVDSGDVVQFLDILEALLLENG